MILYDRIFSPELSDYWDTVSNISANAVGVPLCSSDKKFFAFEKFCNDHRFIEHKVDSVMVTHISDGYKISLIEFKGGKTSDDWDKDCFALKAFDTIHCGLSRLINNSDDWLRLFACKLEYLIICSDDNIIFKSPSESTSKFRSRTQILDGRQKLDKLKGSLQRYENKHPFDSIIVTCSTIFNEQYINRFV